MFSEGTGPTVPRHRRNPRRVYDERGREITPATIADAQEAGAHGIIARCACGHEERLPFTGLRLEWFVPDIGLRLRCTACGGKRIETSLDW